MFIPIATCDHITALAAVALAVIKPIGNETKIPS